MVSHYDSISYNENVLLDLPFMEATGTVTRDIAKPHHLVSLVNAPTWSTLGSGLGVLTFNGTNEYAQCLNADSADMEFTSGDYSIAGWINWTDTATSEIIIGRYELSVGGWELYLYNNAGTYYLTLRHHHAGGGTARTGANSTGWTPGSWVHFGVSRSGTSAQFYRNGVAVDTTSDTLIDPETTTQDLVISTRYTKNSDWYKGPLVNLKVFDEELTSNDFRNMYEIEKRWFA